MALELSDGDEDGQSGLAMVRPSFAHGRQPLADQLCE